jgi:hypothetical protein
MILLASLITEPLLTRGLLTLFLHSKSGHQGRDDGFGKAARHAHHGRVFFVKEVARVVGEFELATENVILIVVQHTVLMLIADRHGGDNRDFENSRAPFVIKQHTGKSETPNHAIDNCVGAFRLALHAQAVAAANQFFHHRFGKSMFDLEAQGVVLKSRHGHRLDVGRQLALGHRLVAFGEAGDAHENAKQDTGSQDSRHRHFSFC